MNSSDQNDPALQRQQNERQDREQTLRLQELAAENRPSLGYTIQRLAPASLSRCYR